MKSNFAVLIQANLEELFNIENSKLNEDNLLNHYLLVLKNYLRGDSKELLEITNQKSFEFLPNFYKILIKLRLSLLNLQFDNALIIKINEEINSEEFENQFSYWLGEINFVVGNIYLESKEYENAKNSFRQAYSELNLINAKQKAIKSLFNVLVSESRLNPSKKLLIDYEFVNRKALEVNEIIVAGLCNLNISRELQLIGSLNLALKYVNKSIDLLKSDMGVNHYYSSILHRCHLLIELERRVEAQLDLEEARLAPFHSIQEAVKLLEVLYKNKFQLAEIENSTVHINENKLDPTWKGRLKDFISQKKISKLSDLESLMIESLLNSPKTKNELIELLYGNQIDYSASENRFRVLLSRFKKRHPGLIIQNDKSYRISDEIFFVENNKTTAK